MQSCVSTGTGSLLEVWLNFDRVARARETLVVPDCRDSETDKRKKNDATRWLDLNFEIRMKESSENLVC